MATNFKTKPLRLEDNILFPKWMQLLKVKEASTGATEFMGPGTTRPSMTEASNRLDQLSKSYDEYNDLEEYRRQAEQNSHQYPNSQNLYDEARRANIRVDRFSRDPKSLNQALQRAQEDYKSTQLKATRMNTSFGQMFQYLNETLEPKLWTTVATIQGNHRNDSASNYIDAIRTIVASMKGDQPTIRDSLFSSLEHLTTRDDINGLKINLEIIDAVQEALTALEKLYPGGMLPQDSAYRSKLIRNIDKSSVELNYLRSRLNATSPTEPWEQIVYICREVISSETHTLDSLVARVSSSTTDTASGLTLLAHSHAKSTNTPTAHQATGQQRHSAHKTQHAQTKFQPQV
jgi:hypothetical protein